MYFCSFFCALTYGGYGENGLYVWWRMVSENETKKAFSCVCIVRNFAPEISQERVSINTQTTISKSTHYLFN